MNTAIWWIRKDLRLEDNPALHQALTYARQVIPVFILDKNLLFGSSSSEKRRAFLFDGLRKLNEDLFQSGGRLIIRQGDPGEELGRLFAETNASKIFAEPDYTPYAKKRDKKVSKQYPILWQGSPAIQPPGRILKKDGKPYTVFTPFSRAWRAEKHSWRSAQQEIARFKPFLSKLNSFPIDELPVQENSLFPAGEIEAKRRITCFTETVAEGGTDLEPTIYRYGINRDRLDLDDTSRLSPYFRFGMLSPYKAAELIQEIFQKADNLNDVESAESWLSELIWRDFYIQILHYFPEVLTGNFRSFNVSWINDPAEFKAWCAGETGYPIVDAAMRQLEQTGWMHNRARMIVASFLTKDLLIDWRWGEKWFMRNLIDGDPAANNGGWQWSAGTGTDAAPYFRIFNPITQGRKYDPQGVFIRAWIPELRQVTGRYIHTPWEMSLSDQQKSGCRIGIDYPAPIIDHSWARQRALQAYRRPAGFS